MKHFRCRIPLTAVVLLDCRTQEEANAIAQELLETAETEILLVAEDGTEYPAPVYAPANGSDNNEIWVEERS
jgi:hypothetical protein